MGNCPTEGHPRNRTVSIDLYCQLKISVFDLFFYKVLATFLR